MADSTEIDQKTLKAFIKRRHPEYEEMEPHWGFLEACYAGGRPWFDENIFRYLKEGDREFSDRLERAYRFNHSREIVDLVSKYIYKAPIVRNRDDASEAVQDFWKKATIGGGDIDQFSRQMSDKSSTFGRVWVVVDSTKRDSQSRAEEKQDDGRIYAYIVTPQNALDMAFDDLGELKWILLHEEDRDDEDPIYSSGAVESRYRLWTRDGWYLFTEVKQEGKTETQVILLDQGDHDLGVVPVFAVDHITSDESWYTSPALIGDIAYMDRAVANYLSNLDAIIQDQTFSQLAMPAQGLLPGDKGYDQLIAMGTKRIFAYDGENGVQPFYLSPDPKQAELIMAAIKQIINEIYHTVGMAGERTKQDNAVGIDNSSGVAKAYDFERMNALLTSKAGRLSAAENRLVMLVNLWAGQNNKGEEDQDVVSYADTFDTRDLYDEFDIAMRLSSISAPDEVRQKQMEQVIEKLFPDLAKKVRDKLKESLKEWPMSFDEMTAPQSPFGGSQQKPKESDGAKDSAQDTEQS